MAKGYVKFINKLDVCQVAMDNESMDDLENNINYTAIGDGVVVTDVDTLQDDASKVSKKVLKVLPKNFGGLVYITR